MTTARWNDKQGSSRGAWLLKDMPGLLMFRGPDGWSLETVGPASISLEIMGKGPKETWGEHWDYKWAIDFKLDNPEMQRCYPTRGELLDAIQLIQELKQSPPVSDIAELLS